jgi:putative colanic acid biosynthesis UDP-glucose lipid carrier transferase
MESVLSSPSRLAQNKRSAVLTATEPASIFTLKSLLYPVVAVGSLVGCVLARGQSPRGPYFLLAVLTFLASAEFLDVARLRPEAGPLSELRSLANLVWRWALMIAFITALLHLSRLAHLFDYRALASWALITSPLLWLSERLVRALVTHRSPTVGPRKAVIVGVTELGLRLEAQLERDPSLRVKVVGFFEDRSNDRLPPGARVRLLGKSLTLPQYIKQHDVKVVYVTLPMTKQPRTLELLSSLRDSTVSVYFVPDLYVFDVVQARFDVIGGVPVVAVCESPFYGASGMAKRCLDVVIASTILFLSAPLLLLIAIAVRMSSQGPIIFKQRRYGLDGLEIRIYKFRTMTVTEDGDAQYRQVTPQDSRVTPMGSFLRRTSLDELPQLMNVLEGSLSIVGPRPHAIAVNEQYRKLIPGYMLRHKIKPGITGWAQINGYRGGDDLESMRKRVEYDLDYLRHWSVGLDLSIIFRTAATVLNDRRAY